MTTKPLSRDDLKARYERAVVLLTAIVAAFDPIDATEDALQTEVYEYLEAIVDPSLPTSKAR